MKLKVLHCPTTGVGNPQGLAKAERYLGLDSKAIALLPSSYNYQMDQILLNSDMSLVQTEKARWRLFFIAKNYDVIHYNFGQTIMPSVRKGQWKGIYKNIMWAIFVMYTRVFEFFDMRVFKKMGKAIVITFQGNDARQGDFCRNHFSITLAKEPDVHCYDAYTDRQKRRRIKKIAKYADMIYAVNPDLLHVLPQHAKFLPYAHVDMQEWTPVIQGKKSNIPKVLHAPSNRITKGTKYIINAVERLKAEGVQFEFVLVEGMTNQEAKQLYMEADLLIDQLLIGWYGGLAVEVMALGKPVICYIREEDLEFIPSEMRSDLPIIRSTPDSIYSTLKYWLTDGKSKLPEMGEKSRRYVENWHDPQKIAMQLKTEYKNILALKKH